MSRGQIFELNKKKLSPYPSLMPLFLNTTIQAILFVTYTHLYFLQVETRLPFQKYKWILCLISIVTSWGIWKLTQKRIQPTHRHNQHFQKFLIISLLIPFFLIYTLTPLFLSTKDTHPAKIIPFAIEKNGNLYLDEFLPINYITEDKSFDSEIYYAIPIQNHYLSSYPILPGIMNFMVLKFLRPLRVNLPTSTFNIEDILSKDTQYAYYLEKYSASFYATLTNLILLKYFLNFYSIQTSLLSTILFAFCTSHYSNSSQALWQHGFVELDLVLCLYLFSKNKRITNLLSSFLLGFLVFIRPTAILLAVPIFLSLKNTTRKDSLVYISFSCSIFLSFIFNYFLYKHPLGGYPFYLKYSMGGLSPYISSFSEFLRGFFGLTISPGFGYLVFSPIFLLAFIVNRKRSWAYSIGILMYTFFYSFYLIWWGGFSYGARFLIDINPFLILIFIPNVQKFLTYIRKKKFTFYPIVFILLFIVSIYIQNLPTREPEAFSLWHLNNQSQDYSKLAFAISKSPIFVELIKLIE